MKIPQLRRGRFLIAGCVGAAVVGGLVLVWAWPSAKAGTASQAAGQVGILDHDRGGRSAPGQAGLAGQDSQAGRRGGPTQRDPAADRQPRGRREVGRGQQRLGDRLRDVRGSRQPGEEGGPDGATRSPRLPVRAGRSGAGRRATPRAAGVGGGEEVSRRRRSRGGGGQAGLVNWPRRTIIGRETLRQHNAIAPSDADQMETEYRSAAQRYQLALLQARQLYRGLPGRPGARRDLAEGGGGLLDPGAVRRLRRRARRFGGRAGDLALSQRQAGHRCCGSIPCGCR